MRRLWPRGFCGSCRLSKLRQAVERGARVDPRDGADSDQVSTWLYGLLVFGWPRPGARQQLAPGGNGQQEGRILRDLHRHVSALARGDVHFSHASWLTDNALREHALRTAASSGQQPGISVRLFLCGHQRDLSAAWTSARRSDRARPSCSLRIRTLLRLVSSSPAGCRVCSLRCDQDKFRSCSRADDDLGVHDSPIAALLPRLLSHLDSLTSFLTLHRALSSKERLSKSHERRIRKPAAREPAALSAATKKPRKAGLFYSGGRI